MQGSNGFFYKTGSPPSGEMGPTIPPSHKLAKMLLIIQSTKIGHTVWARLPVLPGPHYQDNHSHSGPGVLTCIRVRRAILIYLS